MATPIPSIVKDQLLSIYSDKLKRGDLMSPDRLREIYQQFRDRFGPQRLAAMDGEALLAARFDVDTSATDAVDGVWSIAIPRRKVKCSFSLTPLEKYFHCILPKRMSLLPSCRFRTGAPEAL